MLIIVKVVALSVSENLVKLTNGFTCLIFLTNSSFTIRDLSEGGLQCQVLNLRSSNFQKLNLVGEFMWLHTLNLDYSTTLTSFQEGCFACMPNLMCLSMCETRISNLWTTVAALSKLHYLVELRFQNWLCCNDVGSSGSSGGDDLTGPSQPSTASYHGTSSDSHLLLNINSVNEQTMRNEEPPDDSEVDCSTRMEDSYMDSSSNPRCNRDITLLCKVNLCLLIISVLSCSEIEYYMV